MSFEMMRYFYSSVMVSCPLEDHIIDEHISTETCRGGVSCIGSLKIVHANKRDLGNFQTLLLGGNGGRGKDGAYKNIKRVIKRNIVIQMETLGNCCWEIYAKRTFKGRKQHIYLGESFPEIKPVLAKKLLCEYDYDDC